MPNPFRCVIYACQTAESSLFSHLVRGLLFAWAWTAAAAADQRPNIVILFADDLGYGELGCQGNAQIPTPHIDSIAAAGIRFTDGYVTEPVCSPSRAGLLTGRYQHRFGYTYNVMPHVPGGSEHGLSQDEVTLGDHLNQAGYATGIVGKWHLGARKDFNPIHRGFDFFFGFAHEGHYFVPPPYRGVTTMLRKKPLPPGTVVQQEPGPFIQSDGILYHEMLGNEPLYDLHNPLLRGEKEVQESAYLTDAFTREALGFIDRNHQQPFFLYLSYNAVHSPLQGADAYMEKFAHIDDIQRRIFAAMLSNLDDSVGQVLEKLREHQLEENTLIFFLSDNGGPTKELTSSNLPLSGGKGSLEEGGIRVPFMVQWKSRLPSGHVESRPAISLDIFATAAAVSQRESKAPLDGVNLMPFLLGKEGAIHDRLFWRRQGRAALRSGDWKALRRSRNAPWTLYNVRADLAERNNLATEHSALLADLVQQWETMSDEFDQ